MILLLGQVLYIWFVWLGRIIHVGQRLLKSEMSLYVRKAGVLFVLLLLSGYCLYAQPGDPGGDPDVVPITGIEILIGAGAVLGTRRFFKYMRSKD